jgi:hypothetical protein
MKRLRLSTILLLFIIVAMGMALVVQDRRATRREAELVARNSELEDAAARAIDLIGYLRRGRDGDAKTDKVVNEQMHVIELHYSGKERSR